MDSEEPFSSYTHPMTEQEAIYMKIAEGIEKKRLDKQNAENSKAKLEDEAKKQEVKDKQEVSQTMDPKRLQILMDIAHEIDTKKMREAIFNAIKPVRKQETESKQAKLEIEAKKQEVEDNQEDDEGELEEAKIDRGADLLGKLCEMQNIPQEQNDVVALAKSMNFQAGN